MKRKILIGFGVLLVALLVARVATLPTAKFNAGDTVPTLNLVDIHGTTVEIPGTKTKWTHLQFRRFAGCPICNLHMRSIVQRHPEIAAAGIREVVIFHSPKESLLPYQGNFPFSVIGDPEKKLYAQFGVGTSVFTILDVRAWPAMVRGNMVEDRPKGDPENGPLGLPADFLIDTEGKVVASHYGAHAYDQWSVDELLALVKSKE